MCSPLRRQWRFGYYKKRLWQRNQQQLLFAQPLDLFELSLGPSSKMVELVLFGVLFVRRLKRNRTNTPPVPAMMYLFERGISVSVGLGSITVGNLSQCGEHGKRNRIKM